MPTSTRPIQPLARDFDLSAPLGNSGWLLVVAGEPPRVGPPSFISLLTSRTPARVLGRSDSSFLVHAITGRPAGGITPRHCPDEILQGRLLRVEGSHSPTQP